MKTAPTDVLCPQEFDDLLMAELPSLKMIARRFTSDNEDVNDLVQETILKAKCFYRKFRKGSNFRGWLYIIMRNTYINFYRRVLLGRAAVEQVQADHLPEWCETSSANAGEGACVVADIRTAIDHLPPLHQLAFSLFFSGYKYEEIAEKLGWPVGTVKTRIHFARRLLKHELAEYRQFSALGYSA